MSNNKILSLKNDVVYGPVNSRRLGKSLGINVLTANTKICSLNCLYCQYGYTRIKVGKLNQVTNFFPVEAVIQGLESRLKDDLCRPDYLTFSGNGEATLHPDFPDLVSAVTTLRNKYCPAAKTAILSNGTRIGQPHIQVAVDKLDLKIIKFDCAAEDLYRHYNRPIIPFNFQQMVHLLASMKNVTVQALFTAGRSGNFSRDHLKTWIRAIRFIHPLMVQIYSLDRGYPSKNITKLRADDLQPLVAELAQYGITAQRY